VSIAVFKQPRRSEPKHKPQKGALMRRMCTSASWCARVGNRSGVMKEEVKSIVIEPP